MALTGNEKYVNRFETPEGNTFYYEDIYSRTAIPKLQDGLVPNGAIKLTTQTKNGDTLIEVLYDGKSITLNEEGKLQAKTVAAINYEIQTDAKGEKGIVISKTGE